MSLTIVQFLFLTALFIAIICFQLFLISETVRGFFLRIATNLSEVFRWFAVKSCWLATFFGMVGISYLGISSEMRVQINSFFPGYWKNWVLSLLSYNSFLVFVFVMSFLLVFWGGAGGAIRSYFLKKDKSKLVSENQLLEKRVYGLQQTLDGLGESDDKDVLVDYQHLFSIILKGYFDAFDMTAQERVSLYKFDDGLSCCIGRYCPDDFKRNNSAKVRSTTTGCARKVIAQGYHYDSSFPDPKKEMGKYLSYQQEEYGFDADSVVGMNMKSRAYLGVKLIKNDGTGVGMLLFESEVPDGLEESSIREVAQSEADKLRDLIVALEGHIPNMSQVDEVGF